MATPVMSEWIKVRADEVIEGDLVAVGLKMFRANRVGRDGAMVTIGDGTGHYALRKRAATSMTVLRAEGAK